MDQAKSFSAPSRPIRAELDEVHGIAGNLPLEGGHPAEVLPVGILDQLLHHLFIADIEHPLQKQKGHHDPNRDQRPTDLRVPAAKLGLQFLQWEALGQFHQMVIRIQHHLQGQCPHGLRLFG